jgi:hypothetical protein
MGFSGTSTGQYEKRSIDVVDRFLLSFVEHGGSIWKSGGNARDFLGKKYEALQLSREFCEMMKS